jgi:protein tyrosine phosphatase (PTP) superfamily phosphohydrolase (DUF442 family)
MTIKLVRHTPARLFVIVSFLAFSALPVDVGADTRPKVAEQKVLAAPIKRFLQVDERLYRGGQPDARGFAYLRDIGVDTVISLRGDASSERPIVEALGMRLVHIPLTFLPFGWGDELPEAALRRFFEVVDDPASGIVFFHCQRGADRTGTLAGLYRIARQGWDVKRAYDEARDIGMHWWYYPLKGTLARLSGTLAPVAAAQ